ncbi:hypothetical protein FXW30_02070 [Candidatus Liberibacter asiaticus]|nr:hypothetical protein FXW22_03245 [Candidatus Liberibacter asiaticus]KAE9512156.1 hypothetical protein FXW32_03245 [Candidatus Liberibacter asiaticus]KAE9514370.1 hypothetical protein FXW25_03175 [Candidatus Liberibacter asiaticus]KAE9516409.1 hypothetical protein FXW27_03225 [Candidatus Liberibacter asiaticus]KAE9518488.1 hypothetical protein FXW28_03245 [Candidatus Liberibacter asiaticus]
MFEFFKISTLVAVGFLFCPFNGMFTLIESHTIS